MPHTEPGLVRVPPGQFQRHHDHEAQTVQLTTAVHWQTSPITVGLYRTYLAATGRTDDPQLEIWDGDWRPGPTFHQANAHGDDMPVVGTSFFDALAFITWLRERDQRDYRLPTEAEFEYATRAGCEIDCDSVCVPSRDHTGHHWPEAFLSCWATARQQPNRYGIHGLSGVIWYWCSDWYAPYPPGTTVVDPQGPPDAPACSAWKGRTLPPGRVIRGGSWSYPEWYGHCNNRHFSLPDDRNVNLGFRLVVNA